MITIKKENYFSELGGKPLNEDSFAYIPGSTYLVCDGFGGAGKGDVASKMVVKCFVDSFRSEPKSSVDEVLLKAESQITQYLSENPGSDGMASTLAFAQIRNDGVYIAWIGDTRIYQFRNGELIYLTTDHNWVGEAIKTGVLAEDEAVDHPKSDLVTRLIQGTHKSTKADSGLLTDIQRGDIFLLCSSGVAKTWSNEDFVNLFKSNTDLDELRAQIVTKCTQRSTDNFTGIILQVHDARIPISEVPPQAAETVIEQLAPNNPVVVEVPEPKVEVKNEPEQSKIEFIVENETKPEVQQSSTKTNGPIKEGDSNIKKYLGYVILLSIIGVLLWKWPKTGEVQNSVTTNSDSLSNAKALVYNDSLKFIDSLRTDSLKKAAKKVASENKNNKTKKDTVVKNTTKPIAKTKPSSKYNKYKYNYKKKKNKYKSKYYNKKGNKNTTKKTKPQQTQTENSADNTN